MENLKIEYQIERYKDNKKYLVVKVNHESLNDMNISYLLGEVGEGIILTSHRRILFDLAMVKYINSSAMGSLMNIHNLGKKHNKAVSFKLNAQVNDFVRLTNFDNIADVEMVA